MIINRKDFILWKLHIIYRWGTFPAQWGFIVWYPGYSKTLDIHFGRRYLTFFIQKEQ